MRALVLEQFNGPFVAKDVPTPALAPHEALVRVRNVGVCGTDVKIRANRMGLGVIPLIMGHEIAGEVAEVGREVRGFAPGDRVVVNFYVTCGRCPACRVGRDTLCAEVRQHGFSIDGGFAEYVKTPGVNLCKVPDHVSLEAACILGDAVATSYHAITKRAQVRPGTTLALIGVGGVGLHALQMAKLAGGWVIAVDVNDAPARAGQEPGRRRGGGRAQRPVPRGGAHVTDGLGVDVVLEFVASAQTLPSSLQSLRRAGRSVFEATRPRYRCRCCRCEVARSELEIVGSRANTKQELAETMDLVAQGRIRPIVDRVIPLAEIEDAFTALKEGRPLGRNVLAHLDPGPLSTGAPQHRAPHPALSPEGRGWRARVPPPLWGEGEGEGLRGEAARRADRGLLAVLILAPHLDDDTRAPRALGPRLLHHPVHGQPVARVHRLDEGHGDRAALDETRTEEARHHLRDVGSGHHPLRQCGAEPLLVGPPLVGVDRARLHPRVDVVPPLRHLLRERRQLLSDRDRLSD